MNRVSASFIGIVFVITVILILFLYSLGFGFIAATTEPIDNNKFLVIVDAGHGGEDGGTSAKDGTLEKDINLEVAKKLNAMLNFAGYSTIMTREDDLQLGDTSLPTIHQRKVSDLRTRLQMTVDNPNAILISIHQNYYTLPRYYGFQAFYSNKNENSRTLAETIQSTANKLLQNTNNRTIKQVGSNIYLLYNSNIPSVLVECGFMSNEYEAALLKNDDYQKKIALTIMCGIQKYLEENNG